MSVANYIVLASGLWIVIGLVVAFVADSFAGGRRTLIYNLVIGLIGSIFGGYFSAEMVGEGTPGQFIISVLCSAFLSTAAVYIFNQMILKRRDK